MSQAYDASVVDLRDGRVYTVRKNTAHEFLRYDGGFVVVSSDNGSTVVRIPIRYAKVNEQREYGSYLDEDESMWQGLPATVLTEQPSASIQCANGHAALNMIALNFDFVGTWHQCPQCLTRRLVTDSAVLDEAGGQVAVAAEKTRLERFQAEALRRAEQERRDRELRQRTAADEARGARTAAATQGKLEESKARTALRRAIVASPAFVLVVLLWSAINAGRGFWVFVGSGVVVAAAGLYHWWLVLNAWIAVDSSRERQTKRFNLFLPATNALCAGILGVALVTSFGAGRLSMTPAIALSAGVVYFGWLSLAAASQAWDNLSRS
jgi:hypothetical protein